MKILVADDNRSIPKKIEAALQGLGHEVVGVGHGEAAVKKLAEAPPDLVLADVFMPVRNGYEVCDYVKSNEKYAHIPVVLLVGAFDPVDQHEVKRVRADGVLMKPFDPPDNLLKMVQAMMEKVAQEAKLAKADVGDTLKLSSGEMKRLTGTAEEEPAVPELEPEEYAVRPAQIEIAEGAEPAAFSEMLTEPIEAEAEAPKAAEAEPQGEVVAFRASSVADIEFVHEEEKAEEPARAPAAALQSPAESALELPPEEPLSAEPAEEAAETETPQWGGIEAPPREPSPEEPPIKVEFGASEPIELETEESAAAAPAVAAAGPLPELATSATEFLETAARGPAPAEMPAAAAPFSIPSMEEVAAPLKVAEEAPPLRVQEILPPPAAEPISAPREAIAEPIKPPEPIEISTAARRIEAATGAASSAPAFTGSTDAFARPQLDPAVVEEIVEKVIAQLQTGVLDKITREILRPIVEALVAREIEPKQ